MNKDRNQNRGNRPTQILAQDIQPIRKRVGKQDRIILSKEEAWQEYLKKENILPTKYSQSFQNLPNDKDQVKGKAEFIQACDITYAFTKLFFAADGLGFEEKSKSNKILPDAINMSCTVHELKKPDNSIQKFILMDPSADKHTDDYYSTNIMGFLQKITSNDETIKPFCDELKEIAGDVKLGIANSVSDYTIDKLKLKREFIILESNKKQYGYSCTEPIDIREILKLENQEHTIVGIANFRVEIETEFNNSQLTSEVVGFKPQSSCWRCKEAKDSYQNPILQDLKRNDSPSRVSRVFPPDSLEEIISDMATHYWNVDQLNAVIRYSEINSLKTEKKEKNNIYFEISKIEKELYGKNLLSPSLLKNNLLQLVNAATKEWQSRWLKDSLSKINDSKFISKNKEKLVNFLNKSSTIETLMGPCPGSKEQNTETYFNSNENPLGKIRQKIKEKLDLVKMAMECINKLPIESCQTLISCTDTEILRTYITYQFPEDPQKTQYQELNFCVLTDKDFKILKLEAKKCLQLSLRDKFITNLNTLGRVNINFKQEKEAKEAINKLKTYLSYEVNQWSKSILFEGCLPQDIILAFDEDSKAINQLKKEVRKVILELENLLQEKDLSQKTLIELKDIMDTGKSNPIIQMWINYRIEEDFIEKIRELEPKIRIGLLKQVSGDFLVNEFIQSLGLALNDSDIKKYTGYPLKKFLQRNDVIEQAIILAWLDKQDISKKDIEKEMINYCFDAGINMQNHILKSTLLIQLEIKKCTENIKHNDILSLTELYELDDKEFKKKFGLINIKECDFLKLRKTLVNVIDEKNRENIIKIYKLANNDFKKYKNLEDKKVYLISIQAKIISYCDENRIQYNKRLIKLVSRRLQVQFFNDLIDSYSQFKPPSKGINSLENLQTLSFDEFRRKFNEKNMNALCNDMNKENFNSLMDKINQAKEMLAQKIISKPNNELSKLPEQNVDLKYSLSYLFSLHNHQFFIATLFFLDIKTIKPLIFVSKSWLKFITENLNTLTSNQSAAYKSESESIHLPQLYSNLGNTLKKRLVSLQGITGGIVKLKRKGFDVFFDKSKEGNREAHKAVAAFKDKLDDLGIKAITKTIENKTIRVTISIADFNRLCQHISEASKQNELAKWPDQTENLNTITSNQSAAYKSDEPESIDPPQIARGEIEKPEGISSAPFPPENFYYSSDIKAYQSQILKIALNTPLPDSEDEDNSSLQKEIDEDTGNAKIMDASRGVVLNVYVTANSSNFFPLPDSNLGNSPKVLESLQDIMGGILEVKENGFHVSFDKSKEGNLQAEKAVNAFKDKLGDLGIKAITETIENKTINFTISKADFNRLLQHISEPSKQIDSPKSVSF